MPLTHGEQKANTPPLPGQDGTPQMTPSQKAALTAQWEAMKNAPKALADLILLIDQHPELLAWAKASQAQVVHITRPGE